MKQPAQTLTHNDINPCKLSHRRYAHLHYRALSSLKQMVSGVPDLQVEQEKVCKRCALGKNVNKPFPSSESRSKKIIDLVHSNVCGLLPMKPLGVFLYYVTFIDDFSRKTWIYFMNTKNEVFDKF